MKAGQERDSAAGVAAGGESGPVIVKGKSRESLLLKSLKHDGLKMPPTGKLPDEVIADFARWIDMGAPDPRGGETAVKSKREISIEEGRKWWAFRPLQAVTPPDARQPIDGFIRQAQQAKGLKPNHPASREKLIRRAYFDLIGLPPTEEQIDAFVKDPSPEAYEKLVDELLASPAYGERWARHWLDVARFAESGGYEFDGYPARGLPLPRLGHPGAQQRHAVRPVRPRCSSPATSCSPATIDGGGRDRLPRGRAVSRPDHRQDASSGSATTSSTTCSSTIGGSMLGLTLGCVRCHDHKYDPIPQQDYYRLAAALARTVHGQRTLDLDPDGDAAGEGEVRPGRARSRSLAARERSTTKELARPVRRTGGRPNWPSSRSRRGGRCSSRRSRRSGRT